MNNSVPIKARKSTSSWMPLAVRLSRRKTLRGLTIPPRHDYKYVTSLALFAVMAGALALNVATLATGDTKLLHAHSFARSSQAGELSINIEQANPGAPVDATDTNQSPGTEQTDPVVPVADNTPPIVEPVQDPLPAPAVPTTQTPVPTVPAPVVVSPPSTPQQTTPRVVTPTINQVPQTTTRVVPYYYPTTNTSKTDEPATVDSAIPTPAIAQMASARAVEATSPVTYTSARISNNTRDRLLVTAGIAILASIAMYILATLSNPTNTTRFANSFRVRNAARGVVRS